jgi:CheY-like chemotaxis protein
MPEPQDLAQPRASSFNPPEHAFTSSERAFTPVEQGLPATGGSAPRLPRGLRSAELCVSTYRLNEVRGGETRGSSGETRASEYRVRSLGELRISDPRFNPLFSELRAADVHPVESSAVALVVDDDRRVARLLTTLLAPDFSVLCVKTVAEALLWLRAIPRLDVAFVADDLPDGFGPHLFPWLRDRYPQAPRVLMSDGDRSRFKHADVESAHVLLTKPLNPRWVRCIGSSAGVLRK